MSVIEPAIFTQDTPEKRPSFASVGQSHPLGATVCREGANFSIFSRNATAVELQFFDRVDDGRPARVVRVDPADGRTYHYWHTFVPAVQPGQIYGFRIWGPSDPVRGLRFDPKKLLLDPYGRGVVVPKAYSRAAAASDGDNAETAMKSVVVDPGDFDLPRRIPGKNGREVETEAIYVHFRHPVPKAVHDHAANHRIADGEAPDAGR